MVPKYRSPLVYSGPRPRYLALTLLVDRIIRKQRRLKDEECQVEELLIAYQQRVLEAQYKAFEALVYLLRIRKQKEFLVEKGADIVVHSLSNLDELEYIE